MATTAPTPITAAPPVPDSGQPEPTFDAQYEAFNTWEREQLVPGANALAQITYQNALEAKAAKDGTDGAVQIATEKASQADQSRSAAQAAAVAAAEQVTLAGNAASQAEASRIEASKLNLGAKATAPTVDNQGQALRVGATYFDTALLKWRAWTGTAWADPVNVTAGVKSLNGEGGDLVKTTLEGYGITDALKKTIALAANINLDTVITSGPHALDATYAGAPAGFENGQLIVSRGGSTATQILIAASTGAMLVRGATNVPSSPSWSAWRRVTMGNDTPVAVTGNAIDLNLGTYFADTVSANKTYGFANHKPGSWFCLELTLLGGAVNLPTVVFANNNTAPNFAVNRRHMLFFQLPSYANAWLCSYLGNFPA